MAVNLSKNRLALLTAYQDVIDETSAVDWALYTYEDDSNDLTLASTGDGGLAEITVTFDNSSIMYGFCSLKEPLAALPRYILINWVGEDVPDARKCACASHVATIAEFFQGVDVIINASSVDDIDPSAIGQRLTNGTGPTASPVLSRLRVKDEENTENVGTTYQKTNAEIEMKKINREEFWEQAKREEEMRKEEERRKAAEERQRFEDERMELERKEQEEREKRYRERERQIEEHRKKIQDEEQAREKSRPQPTILRDTEGVSFSLQTEPSNDDQDKKESEVEEAAAIIAQRTSNPREYFKQRERAVSSSMDASPVSAHRTGRLDSPFLRQKHNPCETSPPPFLTPPTGRRQLGTPGGFECNLPPMSATSIPKIAIQEDKEEIIEDWVPESPQRAPVQECGPAKPVQSVAPQPPSTDLPYAGEDDGPLDPWDSAPIPPAAVTPAACLVDLMSDSPEPLPPGPNPDVPQSLLSFDEVLDAPFCPGPEDDPSSLVDVDVAGSHQMTLSYQQALQHASASDSQDLEDSQLLITNGDSLLKEGTQASEGYFSQSQEEDFAQSDECTAKVNPTPVFYNKPPEIDITCWDTDPVVDDED
ncbi:drebrin isoform X2 [Brachyhypopomus gauderio]|uniref:drebrin isoform X2 n=1 Tax=Brachyhypopomus gauderio TaxID=698409 RepID=UPI004042D1A7